MRRRRVRYAKPSPGSVNAVRLNLVPLVQINAVEGDFINNLIETPKEVGERSATPTDPHHTPTLTQPSTSKPQKKQSRRKQRNDTKVPQPSDSIEPIAAEAPNEDNVTTTSNDPLLSGKDRLKLNELMYLCTNLEQKVLDLEMAKTAQDSEIVSLKKRVKKLERRNKSRTLGLKRLRKVGRTARIEFSDEASLGTQEDASKQGRKIANIDRDAEITLVDETQERNDEEKFRSYLLKSHGQGKRMFVDMDTKMKESSKKAKAEMAQESSSKRAGTELEQEVAKKQKIDENVEAKVDDEAEKKKHIEIVLDKEEVAVDAIPLATKPLIIVDWKIIKEGKIGYFQIIRADRSSKRYSSMIQMLQNIDREDLETL
ncbi:hypothetical protein Tco_0077890 [Tanacetum coccineum]